MKDNYLDNPKHEIIASNLDNSKDKDKNEEGGNQGQKGFGCSTEFVLFVSDIPVKLRQDGLKKIFSKFEDYVDASINLFLINNLIHSIKFIIFQEYTRIPCPMACVGAT